MTASPEYLKIFLVGAALFGLTSLVYWFYRLARGLQWSPVGRVRAIFLYPLKSGSGTLIPYAQCEELGLRYKNLKDRMFVVYNEERKVVTARTSPNLLRIKVLPTSSYNQVRFSTSSGKEYYDLDLTAVSTTTIEISMKFPTTDTETLHTRDCGDEMAAWISSELERDGMRLGYWPSGYGRDIVKVRSKEVDVFDISNNIAGAYSNMSSFLLLNCSSVEDLVGRLSEGTTVGPENFRGNILIYGAPPYAEDHWLKIRIRSATFGIVKPCVRCSMVTINPKTLAKDPDMEPLKTLKTYRQLTNPEERNIEGDSPVMGEYMGLINPGSISIGDTVFAVQRKSQRLLFKIFQYL